MNRTVLECVPSVGAEAARWRCAPTPHTIIALLLLSSPFINTRCATTNGSSWPPVVRRRKHPWWNVATSKKLDYYFIILLEIHSLASFANESKRTNRWNEPICKNQLFRKNNFVTCITFKFTALLRRNNHRFFTDSTIIIYKQSLVLTKRHVSMSSGL